MQDPAHGSGVLGIMAERLLDGHECGGSPALEFGPLPKKTKMQRLAWESRYEVVPGEIVTSKGRVKWPEARGTPLRELHPADFFGHVQYH